MKFPWNTTFPKNLQHPNSIEEFKLWIDLSAAERKYLSYLELCQESLVKNTLPHWDIVLAVGPFVKRMRIRKKVDFIAIINLNLENTIPNRLLKFDVQDENYDYSVKREELIADQEKSFYWHYIALGNIFAEPYREFGIFPNLHVFPSTILGLFERSPIWEKTKQFSITLLENYDTST